MFDRLTTMKIVSSFALSLVLASVGCREDDASSTSGSAGNSGASGSSGGGGSGASGASGQGGTSSPGAGAGGTSDSAGAAGAAGKSGSGGGGAGGGGGDLSPNCQAYCECHEANCASTPIPGGVSCGEFCATFTDDQMSCRKLMCSLVPAQPNNNHCMHSVGIAECP